MRMMVHSSAYVAAYAIAVTLVLTFGGYVAPLAELKMGIGSTSYAEFIHNMGLPEQLSNVDPIVASFTGPFSFRAFGPIA